MRATPSSSNAWPAWVRWLVMLLLASLASTAFGQTKQRDFDHTKTGYALTGVHAKERCESCHVNGVFKGTPRDCTTCHTSGARISRENVVKPQRHIPTQDSCDACHSTQSFTGAKFSHLGVQQGSCLTCHNGNLSTGKPSDHLQTQASCDTCHRTAAWKPASGFDHSGVTPGTCATCHNGSKAVGKPALHIPTAQSCDDCHRSFSAWRPTAFNHTQGSVANQCATCHSGSFPPADGKSANHIPYQSLSGVTLGNCDSCHKAGYNAWTPARFHGAVSIATQCATCHNGSFAPAVGKPGDTLHANAPATCETCHKSTSNWSGAKVDHSGFGASTNCTSCHNGSAATGKSGTHVPVGSTNCASCHSTSNWKPTTWSHTQVSVANVCSTCHSGSFPPADGKSANHIPYQNLNGVTVGNCDSCHKAGYSAWTPARFHSAVSVTTQCATCHNGSFPPATGKPSTPVHNGATVCESCHKSTSNWSNASVDHSGFGAATNCASCHNGSTATGKGSTHVPVGSTSCFSCHSVNSWKPSKFSHTQVTVSNVCSTCHSGAFPPADGRPANHIPYQSVTGTSITNCDSCHKAGYGAWTPAKFHSAASVTTQCATCHNGSFPPAVGKPSTTIHNGVTVCESCHKSTSNWSNASVDHSGFGAATNCASCHNGSTATGKSSTHVPVGATSCFSCHSVNSWKPSKFSHTQVTVTNVCSTCHSGAFPPADGRPANHIPYQSVTGTSIGNCDSCHKAGYGAWTPARFHTSASVSTQCAICHTGSFPPAVGKPSTPIHSGVTVCESCHKSSTDWSNVQVNHSGYGATTNCASCHNGSTATGKSSTHVPVGATNCYSCHSVNSWKPSKFSHTQVTVTNVCSACHSGAFPPADGRPANHIPYQSVTGTSITNCDSCHKAGYGAWTPARFHTSASVSTQCAICHTGSYPPAVGKPSTPIHSGVTVCESCHKSTTDWSNVQVNHSGYGAATNCASCHNGSTATGKSSTHVPVGATNCYSCHSVNTWKPSKFSHTQVTVTNVCSTCHSGAFPPADGKPANHIPYQVVTGTGITNCDGCHKAGYGAWTPARFHASATVSTQCAICHTGSYPPAVGKPATTVHSGVTICESCHKSTTDWSNVQYTHSPANAVGTGTCDTCHNGNAAKGKSPGHIPVPAGTARCDSCHRSQASFATAVTMNHGVVTTATCKSCHNGNYTTQGTTGALPKPTNHIPEAQLLGGAAMDCKACHSSTTSWGTQRMNHNGSQGGGAGWCKACHASGTNYLGDMEKKSLTHQKKTPPAIDCSESGCHRPLGTKGQTYTEWD